MQQGWCASWSPHIENEDPCICCWQALGVLMKSFFCFLFFFTVDSFLRCFRGLLLWKPFLFLSFATRGWLNGWVVSFFLYSVVMWWCHLPRIHHQLSRIGKLSDGHGCLWVWFLCVVVNVHPGSVSLPACNSDYETPHWNSCSSPTWSQENTCY